jgi:hypothetical protein
MQSLSVTSTTNTMDIKRALVKKQGKKWYFHRSGPTNVKSSVNAYQADFQECLKISVMASITFWNIKKKRQEKSCSLKQEFTIYKTTPYINILHTILWQIKSKLIYAETINKDKKYIPNTSYSNFRKTINKITRKKLLSK